MAAITYRSTTANYTGKNAPLTTLEVDNNFYNINSELAQKASLSFSNIAVGGQTTVVADSANDTLTLVGSGVSITTNDTTDTITFTVPNTGQINISDDNSAATRFITFVDGPGVQPIKVDSSSTAISYVPSTSTMSLSNILLLGSITASSFNAAATTADVVNTNATTINLGGAATTVTAFPSVTSLVLGNSTAAGQSITLFGSSTASSTYNFATGVTANGATKTVNIATGGAPGSSTVVSIGSNQGGSTTVNSPTTTVTNLNVNGNLTVNGTTTTVNSTTTTVDDPIFTVGGDTAPTADDNKDRGIEFRWHNGTSAKTGFFGFDDSTGFFTFIPDGTNTSEVFSGAAGVIDATRITGSAATLTTARTITLAGDVSGSVSFDGSTNVTINTTVQPDSVALGTDTTGNYAASVNVSGNGLTITGAAGEGTAFTVNSNATAANTASTLVFRDASGNFSSNVVTASLSGNATTATTLQTARNISISGAATAAGVAFNGSADISLNVTSLSAGSLTGTIPSAVLGNSTHFVGTTAVALNRASANQALTGISSVALPGATSGTITLAPAAVAGTNTLTLPATTGTLATLADIGNGTLSLAVSGVGLTGSASFTANQAGNTTFTVTSNATSVNTSGAIVSRDGSGNFSAGTITATLNGDIQTAGELKTSASLTTTSTASVTIISRPAATYRTAIFKIQAVQGTNYHTTQITAIHDGTNVSFVEYGTVIIGSAQGVFDVSLSGGNILLTVTPATANSTTFKVITNYITV